MTSDIDWSQYKPGDRIDFDLKTGQQFRGETYFNIGSVMGSDAKVLWLGEDDIFASQMSIPLDRIAPDSVRPHVPPLQPGDGGHDAKEGLPFWVDTTMHLWTVTPFGEAAQWTLMSIDDPLLVWTRRGGVQVKQP